MEFISNHFYFKCLTFHCANILGDGFLIYLGYLINTRKFVEKIKDKFFFFLIFRKKMLLLSSRTLKSLNSIETIPQRMMSVIFNGNSSITIAFATVFPMPVMKQKLPPSITCYLSLSDTFLNTSSVEI